MPPIDESPSFEPKPPAPEARKSKTAAGATEQASPDLINLTLDMATGRIVRIGGADGAGASRELSEAEKARLAKFGAGATLQRVLEQAFEAGIACALGEPAGEEEPPESDDDAQLSHMLLQSLIRRSAAERLMQREILGRAIVGTLIAQAAEFTAATPEAAATH